jgi:hypothetical protein
VLVVPSPLARRLLAAPWALVVALVLAVGLTCALPSGAEAQSARELAQSRALFEQGLEAARRSEWGEARSLFERALAITERPSILLNLAAVQAEAGAVVDSAASYRRYLEIATSRADARNRAEAQRALARVEARVAHVQIVVVGGRGSDVVSLDGRPVEAARLATSIPVDPGPHEVTVDREGERVASWSMRLADGAREQISLRVVERRVVTPVPVAALEPTDGGGGDALAIGLGVGIGAVVVGAVVLGVVLGTQGGQGVYTGNVGAGVIRF